MPTGYLPIVHGVAAVFAIIELGLTAYVVSPFNNRAYGPGRSPDTLNFMVFNSVWSLLVLAYVGIVPIYMTSFFHKLAALALNAITTVFWFSGSIAMAVYWGAPSCSSNTYCGSMEAAIAFGFFLWLIFSFLTVIDALESLRSRGHNVPETNAKPAAYPGA